MRRARLGVESLEADAIRLRTVLPGEWDLLAETVLTGTAASVTFSSISAIYRHLALFIWARTDRAAEADTIYGRFNGDTGNNYDWIIAFAQGGVGFTQVPSRATSSAYVAYIEAANSRASVFSPAIAYIPWYALTSAEKWIFCSNSGAFGDRSADGDLYLVDARAAWRNTNAITSVTLFPAVGPNFVSGSQFTLYGIL